MVRFGIVGFGLHAVKRMMPAFTASRKCQVTALARRDPVKATESARKYNIPHAFTSVEDLCRHAEVDAVFVTSPNALHLPDVLTAVAAGKPVLCEKPMGMNAGECRQMVEAARKAHVLLGIAHVFRFEESTAMFRDAVQSGKVGRPVFARSEFCFRAPEDHPRKWLRDKSMAGAGPLYDIGVHCIDTLRFVLQDEVTRVSARAVEEPPPSTIESSATMVLELSRGTLANVSVSFTSEYRTPFEIVGEHGSMRADDALTVEHRVTIETRLPGPKVKSETVSNHLAYIKQVDAFADAIAGNSPFPCSGEDGWQNQDRTRDPGPRDDHGCDERMAERIGDGLRNQPGAAQLGE
ncbi:MAG: Gfo/Idh/MocA family protein, partial [Terriglobales bacterium]